MIDIFANEIPKFDKFGSLYRDKSSPNKFLDLTLLSVPFWPMVLPSSLHFYYEKDDDDITTIKSKAFISSVTVVDSIEQAEEILSKFGSSYLMCIELINKQFMRMHHFTILAGTVELIQAFGFPPKTMDQWLASWYPSIDLSRYPDLCIRCGAPAFIGFNDVDCSRKCK